MWFNVLTALLVVLIPVIWSTKSRGYGAFSSLMAAVCALVAGAIAFAAWEPASYAILGFGAGQSGYLGELLQGSAFGLGLLLPFLLAFAVLRVGIDSFVKANLDFNETFNMAGGAVCGVATSSISVGIIAISVGFLRLPPSLMGYSPIEERNGQVVYSTKLWIPVDWAVAQLYEHLSVHSFGSSTPLAEHHPDVHVAAAMQRMTYGGASKNTIREGDFALLGQYTIAGSVEDLSKDTFLVNEKGESKKQVILYPDESSPSGQCTLHGYAIRFASGAKEKGGNAVITPAQLRLICLDEEGEARAVHPVAVVAPPEAAGGLYRFRFDAAEGFIASQGGGADSVFAFEFVTPAEWTPRDLLLKNFRVDLENHESLARTAAFKDYQARDKAITEGTIFRPFGVETGGGALDTSASQKAAKVDGRFEGIFSGASLPDGAIMSKNNAGSLELNDKNEIVEGEHTFDKKVLAERAIDKNLRVEKFATSKDTGIVLVQLSAGGARSIYGRSVETAETVLLPVLVDEQGSRYEPIGYYYVEGENAKIRYTPGTPLRSLAEAPALSRVKRDQTLYLIFRPTKGMKITAFAIGSRQIAEFPGGVLVQQ
jgi:hypothetical protein